MVLRVWASLWAQTSETKSGRSSAAGSHIASAGHGVHALGFPHALPDVAALDGTRAFGAPTRDGAVERIAAVTNVDPGRVREWLADTLGPSDLEARTERFEGELVYLPMEDPSFRAGLARPGLADFSRGMPPAAASPQLRSTMAAR
jgi:hypothetical protein